MAEDKSLLEVLDEMAPIKQFDAFPKLPSTYKSRTKFGGFMTIFVVLLSVALVLNDVAEFIWGWSDYEFVVDRDQNRLLNINVDIVVNTPCMSLSIDLRDAVGDRLHLSDTFRRDGTLFDITQAHDFKEHQRKLSTREIVAASRRSHGFFSLFKANRPQFKRTWNHTPDGGACRVFGSVAVRKLSGNFHITTLGHGYGGHGMGHADHGTLNMSHVITEFSFGPYYPDISQPLDYSFETTNRAFVAFQYFITVVPTTYYAPRSKPLYTSQYSVTHYIKPVEENRGTPGIFFKYDLDPVALEIHQRTTSLTQFLVRIVGVIGGVWVCFGWGIKITTKITSKVGITSEDDQEPIAEVTGMVKKKRWAGADLIRRKGAGDAGSPWSTPMASPYPSYSGQATPASPYATFSNQGSPYSPSPYTPHTPHTATSAAPPSPYHPPSSPLPPSRSGSAGFPPSPAHSATHLHPGSPYTPSGLPLSPLPGQGGFATSASSQSGYSAGLAPPSPGYPASPLPSAGNAGNGVFAQQQIETPRVVGPPPPRKGSALRNEKKED